MPQKPRTVRDHRPKAVLQINKEIARRESETYRDSFRQFVEASWDIIEPGSAFLGGMHVDAICEHLQALSKRQIHRLLITIPPRHSKSSLVSVLYPAWLWTHSPTERCLFASYALGLAIRDSVRARRVIESQWYQERWPITIYEDQNTKTNFENDLTGGRQVTSVNGPTTGLGGTHLMLDDPHNVLQAESAVIREQAVQWFRESWSTRANSPDTVRAVIQQRVHQQDVAGYCLQEGGWEHLNLPLEYEGEKKLTSIGWCDPRSELNEILWPDRYSRAEINSMKKNLGSAGVAGQFQQRPVPRGGGTFKKAWLKFWYDENQGRPEPIVLQREDGTFFEAEQKPLPMIDPSSQIASWDLAFKGGVKNDYVVGQVWGQGTKDNRANRYLLAQERGQFDFVATQTVIKRLASDHPCFAIIVEDKANGAAIIASLKNEIPGLIAVTPQGGKESRANAAAPLFESGNIWIPHPAQHPWVQEFIDELLLFPRGSYDDQVDAMSQAIIRMQSKVADEVSMDPVVPRMLSRLSHWLGG